MPAKSPGWYGNFPQKHSYNVTMIRFFPLLPVLFLLSTLQPCCASEKEYTLSECIEAAFAHNPKIGIAREQCIQQQGILTQAKSGYLPQLGVSGNYSRAHVENLSPEEEDNLGHGSINASQLLYDFGKTTGNIKASRYGLDAQKQNYLQLLHDVIFEVKRNFYSVLEKKHLLNVASEAVSNYEQHLYRASRYFDAGVRTRIDVTNAQVELSNARLDLLRAESDLLASRVALERTLGIKPEKDSYSLVADDGALEQFAANKPPMNYSLDNMLATAFTSRPLLHQANALVQSASSSINQARGGYFPTINAVAGYDDFETDLAGFNDQWQVGLGLRWELFSGFATKGKMVQTRARHRELQHNKKDLELAITEDVTDSYLRADEHRKSVDIAAETMQLARENLRLAQERYKAGLNDMIEYNDAQLNFTRSQSNLVSAYYAYLTALARIEHATGSTSDLPEEVDAEKIICGVNNPAAK